MTHAVTRAQVDDAAWRVEQPRIGVKRFRVGKYRRVRAQRCLDARMYLVALQRDIDESPLATHRTIRVTHRAAHPPDRLDDAVIGDEQSVFEFDPSLVGC